MDKIQKLQKAKFFLEMLACSMDPTTQEYVEDSVLNKKEVKEMLEYVSSLLDELIVNNGDVIQVSKPLNFQVSRIDKNAIFLSDEPIQLTALTYRINKQVNADKMQRLGASKISKWLVDQGYLTSEKVSVVKEISQLATTEKAQDFGIVTENKVNVKTGEIKPCVLLTRKAQEYIVDNLELIVGDDSSDDETSEIEERLMVGKPWTPDEEEILILQYTNENLSIDEIAKLHNRNRAGIRARLKKLGVFK